MAEEEMAMGSLARTIDSAAMRLIEHRSFQKWIIQTTPSEGDLIQINNSFVFRSEVKTRTHAEGNEIAIYGPQESNYTTWRLAKMSIPIHRIDRQIAHGDTFRNDRHPDLMADYILANPPFNDSDRRGELLHEDKGLKYGVPPVGNANFDWAQHTVHRLAPAENPGTITVQSLMEKCHG